MATSEETWLRHSVSDANILSLVDSCLTLDETHLKSQLDALVSTSYGLDYLVDDNRQSLLHILALKSEFKYWELLISCFVYIDITDSKLQTALHVAVASNNEEACRCLIKNGASPSSEDDHGLNPIQIACQNNNVGILEILFSSYSTQKYCSSNSIAICRFTIDSGSIKAFSFIIGRLSLSDLEQYDDEGLSIIHYAAQSPSIGCLAALLDRGVDVNKKELKNRNSKVPSERTAIDMTDSIPALELLISRGAKYNSKDIKPSIAKILEKMNNWQTEGRSIGPCKLHIAVKDNNLQAIKTYEGKVDIVDLNKKTPLIYAVENKQSAMIQLLLEKNANPAFFTGLTSAYHTAAMLGYVEAIREFLKYTRPSREVSDSEGRDVITCSILSGVPDVLSNIVENISGNISIETIYCDTLINLPRDSVSADMAKLLVPHGLGPLSLLSNNKTVIECAISMKKAELASVLLKDANISQTECDGLLVEAVLNECDIVSDLIGLKAQAVVHRGRPLFHFTAKHTSNSALKALLELGEESSTDTMGNNYLHRAALYASKRAIEDSFEIMHLPPNATNQAGETPLHCLTQVDQTTYVENYRLLVSNGADPTLLNGKNQNIFHVAAEAGNETALKFLLSESSLVNLVEMRDSQGLTPLEAALLFRKNKCADMLTAVKQHEIFDSPISEDVVRTYLSRGLSPDVRDLSNKPLLSVIIERSYRKEEPVGSDAEPPKEGEQNEKKQSCIVEMVTLLLEAGADPSAIDDNGETPFHHAVRAGDIEVSRILMNWGSSFIIGRALNALADELGQTEISAMTKLPLRRACAVDELLQTQNNSCTEIKAMLTLLTGPFKELPSVLNFIHEITQMYRLISLFVNRLGPLVQTMRPSTEFGPLLLYFVDALMPLVNLSTSYCVAKADIEKNPTLVPFLSSKSPLSKNALADLMFVPVQVLMRYNSLIEAILKSTPNDHPDLSFLRRALLKYSAIGRDTNERQLIYESQKKLQTLKMFLTLDGQTICFHPNDVLLAHDQFTRLNFIEPPTGTEFPESPDWGLKMYEIQSGDISVTYFKKLGKSVKSFFDSEHIAIFLFRKFILFGLLKGESSFKLKLSWKTSEVLWDFSREHGNDSFALWTPIGMMLLKLYIKGQSGDFQKKQWQTAAGKLDSIDTDEVVNRGTEIVNVSWVGSTTHCVHTKQFIVQCGSKGEAKQKILDKMAQLKIPIETKSNALGEKESLVNFEFITHRPAQGQESDILSDVEAK